jgi:phage gp36-like protein
MPYASLAILQERYGLQALVGLTDRAVPPTGVVDSAVVDRALGDADALIDGYLGERYSLPLSPVPPLVVTLAAQIAFYHLHSFEVPEKVKADHDQAVRSLREIAAGTLRIPAAGIEPATPSTNGVLTTDRERPFSPETMTGFI